MIRFVAIHCVEVRFEVVHFEATLNVVTRTAVIPNAEIRIAETQNVVILIEAIRCAAIQSAMGATQNEAILNEAQIVATQFAVTPSAQAVVIQFAQAAAIPCVPAAVIPCVQAVATQCVRVAVFQRAVTQDAMVFLQNDPQKVDPNGAQDVDVSRVVSRSAPCVVQFAAAVALVPDVFLDSVPAPALS